MNQLSMLLLVLCSAFILDSDGSSSFLIYNQDHNKCVYAVSTTAVLSAPCDASFKAQRFRWISSSRIISLTFGLCLGADKVQNGVKVNLQPCEETPKQTWECKNETSLGLKGQNLHLDYGNYNEPNVMLFNGMSVSRWLIYGTEENLCSRGYQETYCTLGDSVEKPCHFPFKFDDKWYADCTGYGRGDHRLWCSTQKDYNETQWGFCPQNKAPVPNITVLGQVEDGQRVMVLCEFGQRFAESSFHLSVTTGHSYTLKNPLCKPNEQCVFDLRVSPPVSFICVHEINSYVNSQSENFNYSPSVRPEEGISLFYICFSSCIAVGLIIMIAAVIVTSIRSNTKDSINSINSINSPTNVTDSYYNQRSS